MTVFELGEWARNGYPVRVDGQDLFLTPKSAVYIECDTCNVAAVPGVCEKTNFFEDALTLGVDPRKVEVLLGKDGLKAVTKHKLT